MNIFDMYKDYASKLFRVLRRRGRLHHDAEDLVQDAFLCLLSYIEKGEKVTQPKALLVKAALNRSVDLSRRERNHLRHERPVEELPLPCLSAGPEDEVTRANYLEGLEKLLDLTVGRRAREVFYLSCFDELTHEEIAEQFEISPATVARDISKVICALTLMKEHTNVRAET